MVTLYFLNNILWRGDNKVVAILVMSSTLRTNSLILYNKNLRAVSVSPQNLKQKQVQRAETKREKNKAVGERGNKRREVDGFMDICINTWAD